MLQLLEIEEVARAAHHPAERNDVDRRLYGVHERFYGRGRHLCSPAVAHQRHGDPAADAIAVLDEPAVEKLRDAVIVDRTVARIRRYRHDQHVAHIDERPEQTPWVGKTQL